MSVHRHSRLGFFQIKLSPVLAENNIFKISEQDKCVYIFLLRQTTVVAVVRINDVGRPFPTPGRKSPKVNEVVNGGVVCTVRRVKNGLRRLETLGGQRFDSYLFSRIGSVKTRRVAVNVVGGKTNFEFIDNSLHLGKSVLSRTAVSCIILVKPERNFNERAESHKSTTVLVAVGRFTPDKARAQNQY